MKYNVKRAQKCNKYICDWSSGLSFRKLHPANVFSAGLWTRSGFTWIRIRPSRKETHPDPTSEKKWIRIRLSKTNRIRILLNFDLIKFIFYFFPTINLKLIDISILNYNLIDKCFRKCDFRGLSNLDIQTGSDHILKSDPDPTIF